MESAGDVIKQFLETKKIEDVTCDKCGGMYAIYETPKGNLGACKTCIDRQFYIDNNIPTSAEYRAGKENGFIKQFERVTHDLLEATVNSFKPDPKYPTQARAKKTAVEFITAYTGKESIVLAGISGIGKSHLSYSIGKAIRNKGYKTLFIKTTDLLDAIKETYNYESSHSQERIFKMIDELDLLVLDDLGGEYEKKDGNANETWASDVLYKVVDMRLGKSLIVTTNYSELELVEKYGQVQGARIVSRMMENAVAIRMEGTDKRRAERF